VKGLEQQLKEVAVKLDELSNGVQRKVSQLEDTQQRLDEFSSTSTQIHAVVKKAEAKITAHLALGSAGNDARHLEKIRSIMDEIEGLQPQINYAANLMQKFTEEDVGSQLPEFSARLASTIESRDSVKDKLAAVLDTIGKASDNIVQYQSKQKQVSRELTSLEEELNKEAPPSRTTGSLEAQMKSIQMFEEKLALIEGSIEEIEAACQDLVKGGFPVDKEEEQHKLDDLKKQSQRLHGSASARLESLKASHEKLSSFRDSTLELQARINSLKEELGEATSGADVSAIKEEQQRLKKFEKDRIEPIQKEFEAVCRMGQGLVQSAAFGVDTSDLENDVEVLNNTWSCLVDKLRDQEHKLNLDLLKSGKFKDGVDSLLVWLDDTEEMLTTQKLASLDHKVIKSHLQMHKVIERMLEDHRESVESVKTTASDIMAQSVVEQERQDISAQLGGLLHRWDTVNNMATEHKAVLHAALEASKNFQDKHDPLVKWIDAMEKRISSLDSFGGADGMNVSQQTDEQRAINDEVAGHKSDLDELILCGSELKKHATAGSGEESALTSSLDSVKSCYGLLCTRSSERLTRLDEARPIAERFYETHEKLLEWLEAVPGEMAQIHEMRGPEVENMLEDLLEQLELNKPLLVSLSEDARQLLGLVPGPLGSGVAELQSSDSKRFEAVEEQLARRNDLIKGQRLKSVEVLTQLDDLIEFFAETERLIAESDPPAPDPELLSEMMQEHKLTHDEVIAMKTKSRDVLSTSKRLCHDVTSLQDDPVMSDKMEELRQQADSCCRASAARLGALEQSLPLANLFQETLEGLGQWLDDTESRLADETDSGAVTVEQIREQQEDLKLLKQSIADEKQSVDRLSKTGSALVKLVGDDDAVRVQDIVVDVTSRFDAIRNTVRSRVNTLDDALQQSCELSDQLENLKESLTNTAAQVSDVEPVSSNPDRLRDQIADNLSIVEDMDKKLLALQTIQRTAEELLSQAAGGDDEQSKDVKQKVDELVKLYEKIRADTTARNATLEQALDVSEKFWDSVTGVMDTLKELQESLAENEGPRFEPTAIQEQKECLQFVQGELDTIHSDRTALHDIGQELVELIGDDDKPGGEASCSGCGCGVAGPDRQVQQSSEGTG